MGEPSWWAWHINSETSETLCIKSEKDIVNQIKATVIKHTGSHYLLTVFPEWNPFPAVIRGKVRLQKSSATNPVAVGDEVLCSISEEDGSVCITEVLPRRNYVIRKSTNLSREAHIIAANVDRAFIVVTLAFPDVKLPFLDRLLVTCELYGIPATIVLNKVDLLREIPGAVEEMLMPFREIYTKAGYPVIEVSAKTGEGMDGLRAALSGDGGVNLFSGVSGVGKSSLVKALDPSLNPRTAEISVAHLQGRHTTTFYEMYPLASGGYIIDTPGIRSFGLVDVTPEETALYFPEMLRVASECRFAPCTHTHEPGCAVKAAVEDGRVSTERYNSYLGMLEEYRKYR